MGKVCKEFKCQNLTVDKWGEKQVINDKTGAVELEDYFEGEEEMEEKSDEKYLGDILANDGKNMKNFKSRVNKGTGIVNKIMTRLEGIPFGKYYFEVALILRNSLLVSSVLCNSEAWYNVTKAEMDFLETVDAMLLKKILNAPRSTPKEMLHLELGCTRFRDIMKQRRLSYLHYILNEPADSLVYRFFTAQLKSRNSKDWVTTVLKDLEELELNLSFKDISVMKLSSFQILVKKAVVKNALKELEKLKLSHSKVEKVKHETLEIQQYFMPSKMKKTKEEIQTIFKLRCRVTELKTNLKGIYDTYECSLCGKEEETQTHILECEVLNGKNDSENNDEEPIIDYEEIFGNDVKELVNIARKFKKNMTIKEKILKKGT